jgi:hypothetical protein
MADERDLVAELRVALAPTPVYWGFAPFETASEPPSLPIVVVQRLTFDTAAYEDMCLGPYVGDTVIVIDAWTAGYEAGRALSTQIRDAVALANGDVWRLRSESDFFDPNARAWRIQGQWLSAGRPPL